MAQKEHYSNNTWETGNVITADKMNNIENQLKIISDEVTNAVNGNIYNPSNNDTLSRKLDGMVKYFNTNTEPSSSDLEYTRLYVQPTDDNVDNIIVPTEDQYLTFKDNFVTAFTNQNYVAGAYVEYNDEIYKVISAISKNNSAADDAAAWAAIIALNPSPVRKINVMQELDNLINVYSSDNQLTQEQNRIWINNSSNGVQVPTYEEFSDLKSALMGQVNVLESFQYNLFDDATWQLISLNTTDGKTWTSANNFMTCLRLPVVTGQILFVAGHGTYGSRLRVFYYDANYDFLNVSEEYVRWTNETTTIEIEHDGYIRLQIQSYGKATLSAELQAIYKALPVLYKSVKSISKLLDTTNAVAVENTNKISENTKQINENSDVMYIKTNWVNGNTNTNTGWPYVESDNKRFMSDPIKTNSTDKLYIRASSNYNTAYAVAFYNNQGSFVSRSVYSIQKDGEQIAVDLPDGYIRITYSLASAATMTEEISSDVRQTIRLVQIPYDKQTNGLDLIADINSSSIHNGFLNRNTGTSQATDTDRWKYIVVTCNPGDIFVYTGIVTTPVSPAVYYRSSARFGCSHEPDTTTLYRNEIIIPPSTCSQIGFSWFVAEGYNPCSVYKFSANRSPIFAEQETLLKFLNRGKYDGLRICINGDSISTESAGKWSALIKNHIPATWKNVAAGGTCMVGQINSTSRVNSMQFTEEETTYPPDIILTDGGANDWAQSKPLGSIDTLEDPTTFAGAVQLYIERVITAYPNARMVCWGSNYTVHKNRFEVNPDVGEQNPLGLRITDYNRVFEEVCKYNGIEFVHIYENVGINRYNYATYLEEDAHDYGPGYIHPNMLGGKRYLDAILKYLYYGINEPSYTFGDGVI